MNSVNNKELTQLYEGSKLFVHVDNKNIPFELSYVMNIYLAITNIGILRRIERSIRVIRIIVRAYAHTRDHARMRTRLTRDFKYAIYKGFSSKNKLSSYEKYGGDM